MPNMLNMQKMQNIQNMQNKAVNAWVHCAFGNINYASLLFFGMEVLAIEQSIQWWLQKPTNKFLYASINLPDRDKIWTFSKPNIWQVQTEQMRRQAIYFPDSPTKQISVLVFQLSRSARSSCTASIGLSVSPFIWLFKLSHPHPPTHFRHPCYPCHLPHNTH